MSKLSKYFSVAAAAMLAFSGFAADKYGKTIQAGRAAKVAPGEIKIDGKLSEKVWSKADKFTNFKVAGSLAVANPTPTVMTAYDADNFYIAWVCPKAPVTGKGDKNDGGAMFRDETLEYFFTDPASPQSWRQFVITPDGLKFDSQDGDAYINFDWKYAVAKKGDGYTAEWAIPWEALGTSPDKYKVIRMNFSRGRKSADGSEESASWSIFRAGYRELAGMGFVVFGTPAEAVAPMLNELKSQTKNFAADKAVQDALKAVAAGNPDNFIAYLNLIAAAQDAVKKAETSAAGKGLAAKKSTRAPLLLSNWTEDIELEQAKEFQLPLLVKLVKKPDPAKLNYRMAVNEFAHRAFLVSALQGINSVTLTASDLTSADGKVIKADKIRFYQIKFVTPVKKLWPSSHSKWSGRPLPELVEVIEKPFALKKYESTHIRMLIDGVEAAPGKYTGKVTVSGVNGTIGEIPVNCEVMDFAIPDSRKNPFYCNIFTGIPIGGPSAREYAKLFREYYVSEVTFETPRMFLDGKQIRPVGHRKDDPTYIEQIINHGYDFKNGKLVIDGEFSEFADRVKACAEYGLKVVLSTRTEDVLPDAFPALRKFFADLGLPGDNFIYKMGDEDTSLWQQPLAKRIHEFAPEQHLYIIPSGRDYYDLKPLVDHYKTVAFTRSGLTNPAFNPDLKVLQKQGVRLARYTNSTSWAERDVRLAGRNDLWTVMLKDFMDGYMIWTAGTTGAWLNHRYAYSDAERCPVFNYPPEQQATCCLVYVRKIGNRLKPIASIRLEHMRDGITDYFYFKAAEKALEGKNKAELDKIIAMPKKTMADFRAAREKLIEIILQEKK